MSDMGQDALCGKTQYSVSVEDADCGLYPGGSGAVSFDDDCGKNNTDGWAMTDSACARQLPIPDLDCGKPGPNNWYHRDSDCGIQFIPGGYFEDQDCGKFGPLGYWVDDDCNKTSIVTGEPFPDNHHS